MIAEKKVNWSQFYSCANGKSSGNGLEQPRFRINFRSLVHHIARTTSVSSEWMRLSASMRLSMLTFHKNYGNECAAELVGNAERTPLKLVGVHKHKYGARHSQRRFRGNLTCSHYCLQQLAIGQKDELLL
eukprot:6491455-Amphidinium_carterae.1